jgi:C4-dicarboxylate transporter DctM subunit
MSGIELGGLLFVVCIVLIALRMPVAVAMFVVGAIGFVLLSSWSAFLSFLNTAPFGRVSNYSLSIVPLFLLMGQFATQAGLSRSLFESARAWVGHRRGGLAMATIGGCAAFGAICGSSIATGATMAAVSLPEMKRYGYSGALATGTLAAGAIVPGAIAVIGYAIAIAAYVRFNPDAGPAGPRAPWRDRLRSLKPAWPVAAIFVLVIGGIYLGVFTPTEGAAIGAAATGLVAALYGRLGWRALRSCLIDTAQATAVIFLILIGADVYNAFLALSQLPVEFADALAASGLPPMSILIGVLFVYLLLGCVMDSLAMILLSVPVFFPLVTGLDFGLGEEATAIWFGILVLIVVEVGLITPPIGLNVYVINSLADGVPLAESFKGIVPFLLSDFIRVAIILAAPATCLWLPGLLS